MNWRRFLISFTVLSLFTSLILIAQENNLYIDSTQYYPGESEFADLYRQAASPQFTKTEYTNIKLTENIAPQNEPSVKISRKNPDRVVAAWRDFREGYSPAIRRVGYSYSTDGGATWSKNKLLYEIPLLSLASDPAVTVDADGNFYIATLLLSDTSDLSEVWIYKSSDEAETFDETYKISGGTWQEDKEFIASDISPLSPFKNNLYVSWTRIKDTSHVLIREILFSKSTDFGKTWSEPKRLSEENRVQGSVPAVGPNGEVYVTWLRSTDQIAISRSLDGGENFDSPVVLGGITLAGFPSIAVDLSEGNTRGNVHVVWRDRDPVNDNIYISTSYDSAANWSDPVIVSSDLSGSRLYQSLPWCTVSETGSIYVVYSQMDVLEDYKTTIYISSSEDGGATFNDEPLSETDFYMKIPNVDVRFGEYFGIDACNGRVIPVWTDQRAGGYNMDIYSSVIDVSPASVNNVPGIVSGFRVSQNYPNPFNPSTTIDYELTDQGTVEIVIYNSIGELIDSKYIRALSPGKYSYEWSPDNLPSGIYLYRFKAISIGKMYSTSRKMIYLK